MKNTKWNEDLKNEMFDFFEDNTTKNGYSVKQNSDAFAKLHPEITASQVKTAYYRFYKELDNMPKKDTVKKNTVKKNGESKKMVNKKIIEKKTGSWSNTENKQLLKMLENRGNQTMQAVYEKFSQKTGRPIKNVAQHHYILTKSKEKIDISNEIKKLPNNVVDALTVLITSLSVSSAT